MTEESGKLDFQDGEALRAALQAGDERAFTWLFNRYYQDLFAYACRIMREEEIAADMVQDTFYKLFAKRESLEVHSSLQAYLYKSVYNHCVNEIKRRRMEVSCMDKELADFYFQEILQTPEAEMVLRNEEIRWAVQEAVNGLPERCREIFVLSKMRELSNREIAEKLGISEKTVENQMTKALSCLRKELEWLLCWLIFFSSL